jgi:hypothetical protein
MKPGVVKMFPTKQTWLNLLCSKVEGTMPATAIFQPGKSSKHYHASMVALDGLRDFFEILA